MPSRTIRTTLLEFEITRICFVRQITAFYTSMMPINFRNSRVNILIFCTFMQRVVIYLSYILCTQGTWHKIPRNLNFLTRTLTALVSLNIRSKCCRFNLWKILSAYVRILSIFASLAYLDKTFH